MIDNQLSLALVGLAGAILTIVVAPLLALLRSNTRAQNKATIAHSRVASEVKNLVKETKTGNEEAKDRNGHLADLVIQQGEQTKALAEGAVNTITSALQNVPEQHIEHAHIEHQDVASAVIKDKK